MREFREKIELNTENLPYSLASKRLRRKSNLNLGIKALSITEPKNPLEFTYYPGSGPNI